MGCAAETRKTGLKWSVTMGVIPQPLSLEPTDARFLLQNDFSIGCYGRGAASVGATCAKSIRQRHGFRCTVDSMVPCPCVSLRVETSVASLEGVENRGEGYELTVSEAGVVVVALEPAGLFYGTQTLMQLMEPKDSKGKAGEEMLLEGVKVKNRVATLRNDLNIYMDVQGIDLGVHWIQDVNCGFLRWPMFTRVFVFEFGRGIVMLVRE